jgi:hypothetical protein
MPVLLWCMPPPVLCHEPGSSRGLAPGDSSSPVLLPAVGPGPDTAAVLTGNRSTMEGALPAAGTPAAAAAAAAPAAPAGAKGLRLAAAAAAASVCSCSSAAASSGSAALLNAASCAMAPVAVLPRDQLPSVLVGLLGLNQRSMRWPKCSTAFLHGQSCGSVHAWLRLPAQWVRVKHDVERHLPLAILQEAADVLQCGTQRLSGACHAAAPTLLTCWLHHGLTVAWPQTLACSPSLPCCPDLAPGSEGERRPLA